MTLTQNDPVFDAHNFGQDINFTLTNFKTEKMEMTMVMSLKYGEQEFNFSKSGSGYMNFKGANIGKSIFR